jgi:hypothetical protein
MAEREFDVAGDNIMIQKTDDSSPGKEKDPPAHESSRDLFGIQLEVSNL